MSADSETRLLEGRIKAAIRQALMFSVSRTEIRRILIQVEDEVYETTTSPRMPQETSEICDKTRCIFYRYFIQEEDP